MNKYQQMLEELNDNYICEWREEYDWDENNISSYEPIKNEKEVKSLIKELVNKTIPMKPIEKEVGEMTLSEFYCPSCGKRMLNYSFQIPYCEHCGQKLKW